MNRAEREVKKEFSLRAFTADYMCKELWALRSRTTPALGRKPYSTQALHERIDKAMDKLRAKPESMVFSKCPSYGKKEDNNGSTKKM